MKRRLIVNADDLGRTPGVNRGVFEAHGRGIVTSATLMVNYPAAAEVPELSRQCPGLGIGLHVQLSGGRPLLRLEQLRSLVGDDGRLPPKPDGLQSADPAEVLAEASAQLGRFRELMRREPTHLDSHHHAHRQPAAFAAIVALARQTGRPVRLVEPALGDSLRREGIATTDYFDESFFGETATLDTLTRVLGGLPPGTTELMCHPARVDEELRRASSYALPRERELAVLASEGARAAARAAGVELISFADL